MRTESSDKKRNNAEPEGGFCEEIVRRSGDNFRRCLHCQCCGSGCPVVDAMKYRPNGVIRLVQLGFRREALESSDIWLCMGCNTCSTECPMAVDIAAVMSALRETAVEEGARIAEPGILNFHKEVLNSIKRYGRTHKLEIMMRHKLRQLELFSDIDIGLKMLSKRKLDLRPSKIRNISAVQKLFPGLTGGKE
ncbi:MAG: heterodisulfide reductase [Desulfobacteraceae bacterium]|nr:MAG: heterodisulfide reductase [Desulfobacteraceae bacterium]